ncbi:MAG: 4-hydroxy-tetrahydrodipicolinate synthase [Dehalococcoidia bacterium]
MELGRLITAMVTPFDGEGRVDYEQAQRLAVALLDSGSEGLVVAGTTGESPTLTHDEKLKLFAAVVEAVGGRGAVLAGSGTYSTAESVELSAEAARVGVHGLLLTAPYYNRPPQEGLYRHFETIAASTDLPCVPYNVPSRTGVNMTAETTVRLSRIPNVVGIKEASGDLVQISRIIEECDEGFRVWSGDDQLTLPILSLGGYGAVAVVSHLTGTQVRRMIDAYVDGSVDEAARIHRALLPLIETIMTVASNPMPVKFALNEAGFPVGKPRLPLVEPSAEAAERVRAELSRHHIDLAVGV